MKIISSSVCFLLLAASLAATAAPGSFPASLATNSSGQLELRWPSVTGKNYRIETSADLQAWSRQSGELPGTGAALGQTVTAAGTALPKMQFWRVLAFDSTLSYALPADRLTVWNPGLNAVGGIPHYTNIAATLSPSGGNDRPAIQTALDAAGTVATKANPKVVYLNAGTYTIAGQGLNVPSYVVLRGAGPDKTKLVRDFKGTGTDLKVKIVTGGLGGSQNGPNVATFVYSTNAGATYTTSPQLITFYNGWNLVDSPLMRITFATGDGTNGFGGIVYTAGDIFTIHWNPAQGPFGDWVVSHTGTGPKLGVDIDNYGDPYGIVSIGSTGWADMGSPINLTADAVKGATSVTVSSTAGLAAGDLVHLDELNEIVVGRVWLAEAANEWFSRLNRNVSQRLEIDHLSGNTITFTTPFHTSFRVSQSAQLCKVNGLTQYAGIEDIYAYGGQGGDGGGDFVIGNGKYCWIKHVESERSAGAGAGVSGGFRSVIRDSYLHTANRIYPGSVEYLICVDSGSSDTLVENNIAWDAGKAIVMRASGGGNVIAYNYLDDIFISDPWYLDFIESGANSSHQTTPHFELFEGNQSFNFDSDTTHGNAFNIVAFRNHLTGLRRSAARPLPTFGAITSVDNHDGHGPRTIALSDAFPRACVRPTAHDYTFSFVGNVLGFAGMPLAVAGTTTQQTTALYDMEQNDVQDYVLGMWMLGSDTGGNWQAPVDLDVINSTLRDGNYDFVTHQQRWHGIGRGVSPFAAPSNSILPASLYLTAKPTFFGTNAWPWVTPESATKTATLPARARFDAGTPNVVN
jgi:hypothetical protein